MTRLAGYGIDRRAWTVIRTRLAAGGYNDDGEWVDGVPTPADIKAVVQPVKGAQLMDMPEGIRTEAGWIIWSRSDIALDDRITSNGINYRVLFVWDRDQDGEFYRAALGRLV
ncbi:hypothetical protein O9X80_07655 [Agrobacterium salinitolerans]|uniref:hypothetical protein n=1 Tax=Agrobacterium salinitolerans TaxID=1183413 RepID=UPI0022B81330|nr:hypothetical protein [Agrobacterium salinitolerans]MCZ7974363.1 hypothetical protein [Agrobacterium salinitolerans]